MRPSDKAVVITRHDMTLEVAPYQTTPETLPINQPVRCSSGLKKRDPARVLGRSVTGENPVVCVQTLVDEKRMRNS